jgi:large subunit ribosomal protein L10
MARVSAKRQIRVEKVEELKEKFRKSKNFILTDYRGLTVAEITELRRMLRGVSTEYRVVKNSLTQIAAHELGVEELGPYLEGPTAVAFTSGDPVAIAKLLAAFTKKAPVLQVKAGLVEGRVLPREEILAMAELPPREVLLARLMGLMVAPLRGLVGVLAGSLRVFVVGLDQLGHKRAESRE